MADILKFSGNTVGPVSVDDVLRGGAGLQDVLVLGWTKDGDFYAASSTGSGPELLWLIEMFRHGVLSESLSNG